MRRRLPDEDAARDGELVLALANSQLLGSGAARTGHEGQVLGIEPLDVRVRLFAAEDLLVRMNGLLHRDAAQRGRSLP